MLVDVIKFSYKFLFFGLKGRSDNIKFSTNKIFIPYMFFICLFDHPQEVILHFGHTILVVSNFPDYIHVLILDLGYGFFDKLNIMIFVGS